MKNLHETLKIKSILEKRAIPIDILENGYTHYSKSKDEYIELLDLDLIHFIRIFLKQVEENNKSIDKERIDEMQHTLNQMYEDLQTLKKDIE